MINGQSLHLFPHLENFWSCCNSLRQFDLSISAEFVTEFYKIMLRLIDRGAKRVASSELNLLKYELQGHLWTMREAVTIEKIKKDENFHSCGGVKTIVSFH